MANLKDAVQSGQTNLRTSGGQLASTSQEELQSQAQMAGLSAAPTSPLSAAVLGTSPDAAKMAGSGANKLSALRQTIKEGMDLQTQQRQQQPGGELTAEQQAQKGQLQALQSTGNLSQRVDLLKQSALQAAAPTAGITLNEPVVEAARPPNLSDADWAEAKASLQKFAAGTAETTDIAKLAKALNKPDLNADDLKKFLTGNEEAVSQAVAGVSPDIVLASQLLEPEELTNLSQLLGVSEEELANLNVTDLQTKIKDEKQARFSQVAALRQQAVDINATPAERQQARKLLREMGATGARDIEEGVSTLEEKIEAGTEVSIGGQTMGIEEALSDDNVKGLVKRYFEEPGFAEELAASEPGLVDLIKQNEEELKQMSDALPAQIAEFSEIQTANKNIAQLPNGLTISDDVMKQLIPEWGTPTANRFEMPKIVEVLKNPNIPQKERDYILEGVNSLSKVSPDMTADLAQLDYSQLVRAGLNSQSGMQKLVDNVSSLAQISNVAPEASPDEFLMTLFGENTSLVDKLSDISALDAMGMGNAETKSLLQIIDANRDGVLDSPSDIKDRALSFLTGGTGVQMSLQDLIAKGLPSPKDITAKAMTTRPSDSVLFGRFKDVFTDGKATQEEINHFMKNTNEVSYDDLHKLIKTLPPDSPALNPFKYVLDLKGSREGIEVAKSLPGIVGKVASNSMGDKAGLKEWDVTNNYSTYIDTINDLNKQIEEAKSKSPGLQRELAKARDRLTSVVSKWKEAIKSSAADKSPKALEALYERIYKIGKSGI